MAPKLSKTFKFKDRSRRWPTTTTGGQPSTSAAAIISSGSSTISSTITRPQMVEPNGEEEDFLNHPKHAHITGVDRFTLDSKGDSILVNEKEKSGLVGSLLLRQNASLIASLIKRKALANQIVLIIGPPSTGKGALAVAIARTLASSGLPAIGINYRQVFTVQDPTTGDKFTSRQASDLFKAALLMVGDQGAVIIGGGLGGTEEEGLGGVNSLDYFRYLANLDFLGKGEGRCEDDDDGDCGPTIIVLADYNLKRCMLQIVRLKDGYPKGAHQVIAQIKGLGAVARCSVLTSEYAPETMKDIFTTVAAKAGVTISKPVLNKLMEEKDRAKAHRILLAAVDDVNSKSKTRNTTATTNLPILDIAHYEAGVINLTLSNLALS